MATIVTRAGKGSPLTNNEIDANFNNLNNDKLDGVVTTSATDTTAGRLLKVGDYGAGAAAGTYLFGRANILGTVSQSAGVPTGALMEYGSNANGQFWKYAGGMMVCAHVGPSQTTSSVWAAPLYLTPGTTITFPVAFAEVPSVACTRIEDAVSQGWAKAAIITTTNFVSFQWSGASTSKGKTLYIAVGRWF